MASGKRRNNETFADYRMRLKTEEAYYKIYRKGRLVWNSARQGTYVRAYHGSLGVREIQEGK